VSSLLRQIESWRDWSFRANLTLSYRMAQCTLGSINGGLDPPISASSELMATRLSADNEVGRRRPRGLTRDTRQPAQSPSKPLEPIHPRLAPTRRSVDQQVAALRSSLTQVPLYSVALDVASAQACLPPARTTNKRCSSSCLLQSSSSFMEVDLEGVLIQAGALHTQAFFGGAWSRGPTSS